MRPKQHLQSLTMVLAVTLALGLIGPEDGLCQPRMVLEPEHIDFGDIPESETRLAQVTIRNEGNQPLVIGNVQSTCYCIEPTIEVKELGPNESTTMELFFNSTGFQGHQMKLIAINSNDPVRRRFDFGVMANIIVPLMMNPQQTLIRFPKLRAGQTHTMTYDFQSGEVPQLDIEPAAWPRQWLDIAIERGSDPEHVKVHFTARPEGALGRLRDTVRLNTNVPAAPSVSLEVDVTLAADLILSMERVNLGAVAPGTALHNRLRVTAYDPGIAFKLTDAEIDIPGMQARVVNEQDGNYAIIEGEALTAHHPSAAANRGRVQGVLRIHTDLESTPELQVPVTYILRR